MTERGMIFNGEMVRALLDGRKTQTRRIVKLSHEHGMKNPVVRGKKGEISYVGCRLAAMLCPFGQPGDHIWVREAFRVMGCVTDVARLMYKASERNSFTEATRTVPVASCTKKPSQKWTPSIHMPRWASRITLEITDVRVERLNSISETDARAEGISGSIARDVIAAYASLWRSIYGAESWEADPWIWVIEFRRFEGGAA